MLRINMLRIRVVTARRTQPAANPLVSAGLSVFIGLGIPSFQRGRFGNGHEPGGECPFLLRRVPGPTAIALAARRVICYQLHHSGGGSALALLV